MAESSDRDYESEDEGRQRDSVSRSSDDGAEQGPRNGKSNRGFASMSPERQREIASKGGKASHGGGRPSTRSGGGSS